MKNNSLNKTLKAKTGKDIFTLMGSKDKGPKQANEAPPASETEIALFDIWQSLLGHNRFSIHDDFFHVGGNSLKAVQAVSRICRHFSTQIDLTDIFLQPTIAKLALLVEAKSKVNQPVITAVTPRPTHIPLSFSQERLWFLHQLEGSVHYHLPIVLKINGDLNKDALLHSLKKVVRRHEALRTVFLEQDGQPFQQVKDENDWKVDYERLGLNQAEQLQDYIHQLINKPFDLSRDYMLRANLVNVGERENLLVVTLHHIASDGWSMSIIVNEVLGLYRSYVQIADDHLPVLKLQYADYAIWQRNYLNGEALDSKLAYWKQKLNTVSPLQLPTDYTRPVVWTARGAVEEFFIENDLYQKLSNLSQEQGSTLYMTLLAAFNVLLFRYSGQSDITIGSPVANRNQHEVEELVGFFVNTLVLRTEIDPKSSFVELLQRVKTTTIQAFQHQEVPFEKVVEAVVVERNMSYNPLFQVMFVLQNTPEIPTLEVDELVFSQEKIINDKAKFDITLTLNESVNGYTGAVEYSVDLFSRETISKMIAHFNQLLISIVDNPHREIGTLKLLTQNEEQQLLVEFNSTKAELPLDKTVVALFEAQVANLPDATAIVFKDQQLTYLELNERANQLAHYLVGQGVAPDALIPVCIERSPEMMIGILGILKAGAAYVPIDPKYPQERIQFITQDTSARLVVSEGLSDLKLQEITGLEVVEVNSEAVSKQPVTNLQVSISPVHPAYIIYTSGSTGKPKGVVIEHRSLINYLLNSKASYLDKDSNNTGTFLHLSYTFDASITGIFMPLVSGRSIVIGSKDSYEVFEDSNLLKYAPYDFIKITPAHLELLKPTMDWETATWLTSRLVIGGEALHPGHFDNFIEKHIEVEIVNEYGPTEATVGCSTYRFFTVSDAEKVKNKISIGKPIDNVQIYFLDRSNQLVPAGVPGELCIGGAGLAKGYLNRPELTAEKFFPNPFSSEEGSKLYKTGDLGCWLSDGTIEYLGRIDDQVKIRGHRVELGEVESAILESGLVSQTVVIAKANANGSKRLIGFVVVDNNFDTNTLSTYLQERLPEYMVPSLWLKQEKLPLTSNGKVDKGALPQPNGDELSGDRFVIPRTITEKLLAQIWQELLAIKEVGIDDNFFELGGDSISTIQVVSRAARAGYHLQPRDIFLHQTIRKLSKVIAENTALSVTAEQGVLTGVSGLLPIQKWYLEQKPVEVSHNNQSILLSLDKGVTAEVLNKAIAALATQHDALRFRYYQQEGEWLQEYTTLTPGLIIEDHQSATGTIDTLIIQHSEKYQKSLDIERGDIFRVVLMLTPELELQNRLLFVIHHLAVDGVSWRILLEDLELLLKNLINGQKIALGTKTSSYRQWYNELEQYGLTKKVQSQKGYWKKVTENYSPIPVDITNASKARIRDLACYSVVLPLTETQNLLLEVPKVYHAEINDILLSALAKTLSRHTKSNKITIGLEGHGREHIADGIDTSRTVGWFTNLYPLFLEVDAEGEDGLIKTVKEQLRKVPGKGLGWGVLKYINKEEALQGKEPWDVLFNYLGQFDNTTTNSKYFTGSVSAAKASRSGEQEINEKVLFNCYVQSRQLVVDVSYSTGHFYQQTIASLAQNYLSDLQAIITHCVAQKLKKGAVTTPSDYGLTEEISYKELDHFLNKSFKGTKRKDQVESIYRLSGLQEGMLFHGLYDDKATSYTEQFSCDLIKANGEAIRESWQYVIKKHSILRSAFYYNAFDIPIQCVYKKVELPIELVDFTHLDESKQTVAIKDFEVSDVNRGFDFEAPPLMRVSLLKLSEDKFKMVWTSHHILFDGWSITILIEELLSNYQTLVAGKPVQVGEQDRYEDFIKHIEQKDKEQEELFWQNYLKGVNQSTLLPFIAATTERTKGVGEYKSVSLELGVEATSKVHAFAHKHRLTLNTVMQGVWSCLLHQYTGSSDVVFGFIVSGRPDNLSNVEQRVGMYINTLPLRSILKEGQGMIEWMQELQDEQLAARQHQNTPLSIIQKGTSIKGDLFDTLVVFENYPVSELIESKQWGLQIENVHRHEQTNFPLSLIIQSSKKLNVRFSYNIQLLDKAYVHDIREQFENVLLQIVSEARDYKEIKLLTPRQEEALLYDFNNTKADYAKDNSIVDLFEAQALKTPDAIAIVFEEEQLTYAELNARANQLAHYLRDKGVQAETLVPICIERSMQMLVGILGILKAGGAYVPIDPEYPLERIQYMLEDTAASLVVSSKQSRSKLPVAQGVEVIEIDTDWSAISKQSTADLHTHIAPHQLAYIIYTSGSTGKPKGVMIEHSNVYSFICWCHEEFAGSRFDIAYLSTSICFDLSIYEIFYPLTVGKKVRIVENGLRIGQYLSTDKAVLTNSVPVVIENLLKEGTDLSNISVINMAGEPIPLHVQQGLDTDRIEVRNLYGPTEDTTYSTIYRVVKDECILIGKPIANTSIYIVGKENELVPVGVAGEICIGGSGLARGYLNRPELTAEKFISNPFNKEAGSRLYRTGDLGRWLPGGNIEYLGRIDTQVKIRGYRIELGEIESVLMQSGLVSQAVVIAKADKEGNKRLVGYVVTEGLLDKGGITSYLQEKLPGFMVPALWVPLESLPLTPNGKIDKKALPDVDAAEINKDQYVAPRNETEQKLAEIWQDVLNIERVGVEDNFFELGGHSVVVIRLVSAIRHQLQVEISLKDVFEHPTIRKLSETVNKKANGALLPAIAALPHPALIPLSFSQERLLFIDQLGGSEQYHIPAVLRLRGHVNTTSLCHAFQMLVNRHTVLKTIFKINSGEPFQQVESTEEWKLNIIDSSSKSTEELQEQIELEINKAFDLSKDYMIRAALLTLSADEAVLVVTMHHIASDGWSLSVMVKEVTELYLACEEKREARLDLLPIQYADYALWQRKYLRGEVLENKIKYWKHKLQDVTSLQLTADFPRPPVQSTKGAAVSFEIEKDLIAGLNTLSRGQGATLFMTLLAAFKVLLYRYTSQQDICVGTVVANRPQHEVEGLIGFFVNTLALRTEIDGSMPFTALLQQVRQTTMEAFEHQEVPFEKVVEAVVKERDLSRTPLFQVMFTLNNTPAIPKLQLGNVELEPESFKHTTSQFDLSFSMTESVMGLEGMVEYCTDLFTNKTINSLINHFKLLLNAGVKNPYQQVGVLPMLSTDEQRLLTNFNNNYRPYSTDRTVVDLFKEQALKTPFVTALIFQDQQLTYKELDERSNQLAHYLQAKGVQAETLVPICLERSLDMLVGILGILKAGGAYVPVDPEYPLERIQYMLEDTAASLVVSSKQSRSNLLATQGAEIIEIDTEWSAISKESTADLHTHIAPDQLAYIIYTSGSTGKPKGVMIEHSNVYSFICWCHEEFSGSRFDIAYLSTSICFDLSIYEIFYPLTVGKKVRIVENGLHIGRYLSRDKEVLTNSVPVVIENLLKEGTDLSNISVINMAGEPIPLHVQQGLDTERIEVRNLYGPTEDTTYSTIYRVTKDEPILIGKPIANTSIYIVGKENELVPVGVAGEICIGGLGLARGYLNRPELTAEKFVKNPFSKEAGSRLYRTGDLGRWLPDGNIEYLGRIDDQVKIRGYRIELGEIESVLLQSGLVRQAVVLAKQDKDHDKKLVGYVVAGANYDKQAVLLYLKHRLPHYMLPTVFVELLELPVTPNGKIDKKVLLGLNESQTAVSKIEEHKLLFEFNDTDRDFSNNKTIIDLFEEQVLNKPDDVAVKFDQKQVTYKQLDERANRLAVELRAKGVKEDTLVLLYIERSIETIIGILGILKSGGAYVPVDVETPAERTKFIFDNTGADIIVTTSVTSDDVKHFDGVQVLKIDKSFHETSLLQPAKDWKIRPEGLAYVIYTSGSTGTPKGVLIEHKGIVNLIEHQSKEFNISSDEKILFFSNFSFDASVEQIFLALCTGSTLVAIDKAARIDANYVLDLVIQEGITHLDVTPSYLQNIVPGAYGKLKRIIVGGEACPLRLAKAWASFVDFYNVYGPTEATISSVEYKYQTTAPISVLPIGRPISNTQIYIVNKTDQIVPIGIVGELLIGGVGIARGYLNERGLNDEKFICKSFVQGKEVRLYRTGDIGKWLPDGNLVYVGRMDNQVKIRGYRVELNEIEAVINECDLVSRAVVLVTEDTHNIKNLVAYVVPVGQLNKEVIIDYLKAKLPDYMVPRTWVELEQFPLMTNGKIDKKALPDPFGRGLIQTQGNDNKTALEIKLIEIWQEILQRKDFDADDNFFEIGGHSLLAMRLIALIKTELQIEVSIKELFLFTTISELSKYLEVRINTNKTENEEAEFDLLEI